MSIRFQRNPGLRPSGRRSAFGDGFGEWWAAIGIVAIAALAALSLGGKAPTGPAIVAASPTGKIGLGTKNSPAIALARQDIAKSLRTAEQALADFDRSLRALCREPVLAALELVPDCASGVMTLPDTLFDGRGGSKLNERAREDVRAAVTSYLEALRRKPALWESLEAIEIRGHADPRAFRNAYTTNLVGSQQRALGVLYFLTGENGLSEKDREDLERLASVSGVSFSRPPKSCPEAVRECFPKWRRVEIRPVFSESRRRDDWARTVESVQIIVERATETAAAPR